MNFVEYMFPLEFNEFTIAKGSDGFRYLDYKYKRKDYMFDFKLNYNNYNSNLPDEEICFSLPSGVCVVFADAGSGKTSFGKALQRNNKRVKYRQGFSKDAIKKTSKLDILYAELDEPDGEGGMLSQVATANFILKCYGLNSNVSETQRSSDLPSPNNEGQALYLNSGKRFMYSKVDDSGAVVRGMNAALFNICTDLSIWSAKYGFITFIVVPDMVDVRDVEYVYKLLKASSTSVIHLEDDIVLSARPDARIEKIIGANPVYSGITKAESSDDESPKYVKVKSLDHITFNELGAIG